MKLFTKIYSSLLSVLTVIGMLGYIISVCIQVFSRTFLPTVPSWTEEVARYLFVYSVAIGSGIVALKDDYARVDIVENKLNPTGKRIFRIACCVLMLALNVFLLIYSVPSFVFLKFRMVSTALQMPMQIVYFSVLVFVSLQIISIGARIIMLITNRPLELQEDDK